MGALRVKLHGTHADDLLPRLRELGLVVVEDSPDVVISYGGDGTLLDAERAWPGVAKLALRDSRHCRTCSHSSNEELLSHLAQGKLKRTRFLKLRAAALGQELTCINDVMLSKARVNAGVRYQIWIDGEPYGHAEIVGDGLVVATPFGSTAYYRSITQSVFRVGIGLAFNNTTEPINHLVIADTSTIRVRITRGPALLTVDSHPQVLELSTDDEAIISQADHHAVILAYDRLRYPTDQFLFPEKSQS